MRYSDNQIDRLRQLNADESLLKEEFDDVNQRNSEFKKIENDLVCSAKDHLKKLLRNESKKLGSEISDNLTCWLNKIGFMQVVTPTIISDKMLDKMSIDRTNHLREQVFWVDRHKCLRPMLAPNLYIIMRELKKSLNIPVKIFEIGSCFRKESQGSKHMNEFTMLNLVEFASVKEGEQREHLEHIAREAMEVLGIKNYDIIIEDSTVYGHTLDIEINGIEVASGAYGPHKLDSAWEVFDTWVGIGFGIERLALAMSGGQNIKRFGKSTKYIDGMPISL